MSFIPAEAGVVVPLLLYWNVERRLLLARMGDDQVI